MAGQLTTFIGLPNGNLEIALTDEGRKALADEQEWFSRHPDSNQCMHLEDWIDYQLCNGWEMVPPEDIGALTDSPILSSDIERDGSGNVVYCGKVYWYPAYAVRSPEDVLTRTGRVVFEGVE